MIDILGKDHPSLDKPIAGLDGGFVADWLNNETTRADLNIPTGVHAWEMCTDRSSVDKKTYIL